MSLCRRVTDAAPHTSGEPGPVFPTRPRRRIVRFTLLSLVSTSLAACSPLHSGPTDLLSAIRGAGAPSASNAKATGPANLGAKPSATNIAANTATNTGAKRDSKILLASHQSPEAVTPGASQPDAALLEFGKVSELQRMSLDEIIQMTVGNHPTIAATQAEVAVAEGKLIGASLLPNPQFTIDAEQDTQEAGPFQLTSRLMFAIPLGGRIAAGQRAADLDIARARYAVSRETEVIINDTIVAALEVLYLQEMVELQGDLVRIAQEGADAIKESVEAGRDDPSSLAVAQVRVADNEFRRLDSDAKLRGARIRLSKAMGLNPPREIEITGRLEAQPLPRVSIDSIFAAVRENRPEIAEAHAAIAHSQAELALARAEAVPDLEIGPRFSDKFRDPGDSLGVRFQTDLPLFDRKQGDIAEKMAETRMNQALLRFAEMTTLSDVAEAYAELVRLQAKLNQFDTRVVPLIEEATKTVQDSFALGKVNAHNVTNELERLAKLRIDQLDLRYRYTELKARIELYTGRPLEQLVGGAAIAPADMRRASPPGGATKPRAGTLPKAAPANGKTDPFKSDDPQPGGENDASPMSPAAGKPSDDPKETQARHRPSRPLYDGVIPASAVEPIGAGQHAASAAHLPYATEMPEKTAARRTMPPRRLAAPVASVPVASVPVASAAARHPPPVAAAATSPLDAITVGQTPAASEVNPADEASSDAASSDEASTDAAKTAPEEAAADQPPAQDAGE
jgi:cobalt-zinc-cadmium efflux system outer membrane protein